MVAFALGVTAASHGATLRGVLRYAGRPSAATLPALSYGTVALTKAGEDVRYVAVDTVSSTWTAAGLARGTYTIHLALARSPIAVPRPVAGSAFACVNGVRVAEGNDTTLQFDLKYVVHATLPFDNAGEWPGGTKNCPFGPVARRSFTLAWEAVPQAVGYRVRASRWSCTGWLLDTTIETTATAVTMTQRAVAREQFIILEIQAIDRRGGILSMMPQVHYGDGSTSTAHYVHLGRDEAPTTPEREPAAVKDARVGASPSLPTRQWPMWLTRWWGTVCGHNAKRLESVSPLRGPAGIAKHQKLTTTFQLTSASTLSPRPASWGHSRQPFHSYGQPS